MMKKIIIRFLVFLVCLVVFMRLVYVASAGFPDRSGAPLLDASKLELVADLSVPPANIAVNAEGRVFITLHPEARPEHNLGELVDGRFAPWQSQAPGGYKTISNTYAVRFDGDGLLWVLDNYPARLVAFDIDKKVLVQEYIFDSNAFPLLSHANDFQISPDGNYFYIADDGLFNRKPALVVYDRKADTARRFLESDKSVVAGEFTPVVQGVEMTMFGLFSINPGVDGIALSRDGQWLYFASFSADKMYRIDSQYLQGGFSDVGGYVEEVGVKTFTDGMTTDLEGRLYLSDIEHSAIVRLEPNIGLQTIVQDERLRWPDGFSFDSNGYLYVACSALHQVIMKSQSAIQSKAPYQIYRIKITENSIAGH